MKIRLCAATLAGLATVLAAAAMAQSTIPGTSGVPTSQPAGLSDKTVAVLRTATSANLFEMESSRLALTRSQSKAIKEFADRIVAEHTRAANRARQVLNEIGASAPPALLEPGHQQQLDALKAVANAEFDRAFVEVQYTAHVEAIGLMRDYARSGDNERLKALAGEMLALLQSHLDHVTRLRDGTSAH